MCWFSTCGKESNLATCGWRGKRARFAVRKPPVWIWIHPDLRRVVGSVLDASVVSGSRIQDPGPSTQASVKFVGAHSGKPTPLFFTIIARIIYTRDKMVISGAPCRAVHNPVTCPVFIAWVIRTVRRSIDMRTTRTGVAMNTLAASNERYERHQEFRSRRR